MSNDTEQKAPMFKEEREWRNTSFRLDMAGRILFMKKK